MRLSRLIARNYPVPFEARMEEILEFVYAEIYHSGYQNQLVGGIVLTGGGSQLQHMKQLAEHVTGMDARIGIPGEHLAKKVW